MAIIEQNALLRCKDEHGNEYLLYPVTTIDCVDGAEDLVHFDKEQELTAEQKAQFLKNIGGLCAPASAQANKFLKIAAVDDKGNVTAVEAADVAGGSGGSGEAVQSDWNVTDETDSAYIKNKPFGAENSSIVIDSNSFTGVEFIAAGMPWSQGSTELIPRSRLTETVATVRMGGNEVSVPITDDMIVVDHEKFSILMLSSEAIAAVCYESGDAEFSFMGTTETVTIPATGMYFMGMNAELIGETTITLTTNGIKKLDNRYLSFINKGADGTETIVKECLPPITEEDLPIMHHERSVILQESVTFIKSVNIDGADVFMNASQVFVSGDAVQQIANSVDARAYVELRIGDDVYKAVPDLSHYNVDGVTSTILIGNGHWADSDLPDTGKPYMVIIAGGSDYFEMVVVFDSNGSVVEGMIKPVVISIVTNPTIKPEYLPDNLGGGCNLPEVTTADAGKFLRVTDEGVWGVESIPNAEGVGF